jgi:hypothetical protein
MNHFEPNSPSPSEVPEAPNTVTESVDSVDFYFDGPGDTTVRPRRPEVPRFWPADMPLPNLTNPSSQPENS